MFQHLNHRGARRRIGRERTWKLIWKNNEGRLPQSGEGNIISSQRLPKKLDPRRNTPRHIIITLPKIKQRERILKAAREKETVTYKGIPIRLSADFSKETLPARRDWHEAFKVEKSKDLQPRLLYPAKLSFRMKGQIKSLPDKVKLKEFIITKTLLHEMLKGFI